MFLIDVAEAVADLVHRSYWIHVDRNRLLLGWSGLRAQITARDNFGRYFDVWYDTEGVHEELVRGPTLGP